MSRNDGANKEMTPANDRPNAVPTGSPTVINQNISKTIIDSAPQLLIYDSHLLDREPSFPPGTAPRIQLSADAHLMDHIINRPLSALELSAYKKSRRNSLNQFIEQHRQHLPKAASDMSLPLAAAHANASNK
jgi:hypothetical protein